MRRHASGTRGRCVPVDVSQWSGVLELAGGTASTTSVDDGEDWRAQICGSVACVLAIAAKSTVGG